MTLYSDLLTEVLDNVDEGFRWLLMELGAGRVRVKLIVGRGPVEIDAVTVAQDGEGELDQTFLAFDHEKVKGSRNVLNT